MLLFAGEQISEENFRGSILIPPPEDSRSVIAYGARGGYVTSQGNQRDMLAQLVEEYNKR